MKPIYAQFAAAVAISFAVAACVPQPQSTPAPSPTPTPIATPAATPPPVVSQPVYDNWMDAPQTPGDWSYRSAGNTSFAVFGPANADAHFTMTCNRAERTITLARAGQAEGVNSLIVRTETGDRTFAARSFASPSPRIVASLSANDRFLDAMAISKGRFAVESPGFPTLYIPSWPEVTRVIEDCR